MSLSREDRLGLAVMDPELCEFLRTASFPQIDASDPARVIAGLRRYMKSQHKPPNPESGVVERDIHFPARDAFQLRAHVFETTKSPSNPRPLIVYYHGGGWTIGSPEDTASACRRLVQELGVTCIAPSYRQGPEDPFPAGINDAWDGLKWIAANAELALSVSLSAGFVVGGSSAGGNMSAVLAHLARDEGLAPAITGTFLLAPSILPPETKLALPERFKEMYLSRTQEECKQDPILSPAIAKIFHDAAKGDPQSPMSVPFIWQTGHRDLPRTYLQICGMDVNRDEDLIYEEVLKENGVPTKSNVYPGMPHIFWGAFPMLTQGKQANLDFVNGVKWLLKKD